MPALTLASGAAFAGTPTASTTKPTKKAATSAAAPTKTPAPAPTTTKPN